MTCRVRIWRLGPLGRSNRRRRRSFSREFDATNEAKRDGGVTRASFAATLLRKFDVTLAPPQLEALWRQYVPFFVSLMFSHLSGVLVLRGLFGVFFSRRRCRASLE